MKKICKKQHTINQIRFISSQMEVLSKKLEELGLFEKAAHLEEVIESYNEFMIKTTRELVRLKNLDDESVE